MKTKIVLECNLVGSRGDIESLITKLVAFSEYEEVSSYRLVPTRLDQ